MEEFNTLEKVRQLFRSVGCEGNENCYFVAMKDAARAKSGLVGGMEYPYDGLLLNRTENGLGIFYLRYIKVLTLKADFSNMQIAPKDAYHFIPNGAIGKIDVKKGMLNSKVKRITIKTTDRKHCLMTRIDEPSIPYHRDNLAKFESLYAK